MSMCEEALHHSMKCWGGGGISAPSPTTASLVLPLPSQNSPQEHAGSTWPPPVHPLPR